MNIQEKVDLAVQHIVFIAGHDDAPVAEVRTALKAVAAFAINLEKQIVLRRLGNVKARVKAYFLGIVKAFVI